MKKSLAVTLLLVFTATSSYAQSRRGHSGGGHGGSGHGGDRAVPRSHGGGGGRGYSGAAARHPQPGGHYSHGGGHGSYGRGYSSYGRGHGYYGGGHGYYSRGYYGRGYGYYGRGYGYYGRGYYGRGYGYYPYYGYPYYGYGYPYYGYGYPWSYGFGIGLSFGSGYVSAGYGGGYVNAGYGGSYAIEAPRVSESRQGEPAEEYVEQGERRSENGAETAELRLVVVGPEDASVYVDNEFRGLASRLVSVRVLPGTHRVEVVRPGYAVAEREVHVGRGATASLQIDLQRH